MVALRALGAVGGVGEALSGVAAALENLEFGHGATHLASERDRLVGTIRSYLIPRTEDPDQPLLVVVAGPTGSGKSTLINSLSGLDVSTTGPVRPTTRVPVVLTRSTSAQLYELIGGVRCEVVTRRIPILESLVLVDAPDLDSTATHHRAMAETLIDNADVVVFVTSALRYADEVPWQVLRRAVSRGTPLIHVLNRVTSASSGAIVDFRSRLSAVGMDDHLITVSEHHLAEEAQQVSSLAVRALRSRLDELVANRADFSERVFQRVLRSTIVQARDLADSLATRAHEIDDLEAELSVDLAERASALDLVGDSTRMYPEAPLEASPRRLRRWMKTVDRADPADIDETLSKLIDRIAAMVESDLRRWLVDDTAVLETWNVVPTEVLSGTRSVARTHLEAWVSFVARIVTDGDHRHPWLAEAVLLDAAIRAESPPEAAVVFGEDSEVLVERAGRELAARLELIYEHVVRLVVDQVSQRYGALDTDDLRIALGAMTALAAVDA